MNISREITTDDFNALIDRVMEEISWKLPKDITQDEYNSLDDSIQHALRDLFVFKGD
jgi:hypothetical protein